MNTNCSPSELSNEALDLGICEAAADKHTTNARLLAFIAEYDLRQRHVALGYESLREFCVQALHLTQDSGYKRIQAARVAREFPALFPALADGRLCLTAVNLLAPHLTAETADELIGAATYKTKTQIRQWLAERFPKEQPSRMSLLPAGDGERHPVDSGTASAESVSGHGEGSVTQLAPAQVEEVDCWARVTPLSGDRYSVSLTIDGATLELWRRNQSLLSHQIPSGNLAEVLRRALAESARQFEKRRFRSSGKVRRPACRNPGSRYIPKHVRDAVWRRDEGRCTFVGETGHRCGSQTRLELDHIVPVARGGGSTVDNLRLRCRVHNQYGAECALGLDFMRHKREQAQAGANTRAAAKTREPAKTQAAAKAREAAAAPTDPRVQRPARSQPVLDWYAEAQAGAVAMGQVPDRDDRDVVPWLRELGARADDARRAAAWCESIPEAPLEERLGVALKFLYGRPWPAPEPRIVQSSARCADS